MEAPDKIYIFKGDAIKLVVEQPNNVEYIRKDLLLEWAKERYQQTISNVGCYTGHSVWTEVIEHIEAL